MEVSGDWTQGKEFDDAIGVWGQVADFCHQKGINKILSIWDVPGRLPTISGYQLVELSNKFNWDRHFKLAVVHLHEERFKDSLFVETVAANRGYLMKMFEDEQEAKSWLLGS